MAPVSSGQRPHDTALLSERAQPELSIHCHFDDFCKLQQSTSRHRRAQSAAQLLQQAALHTAAKSYKNDGRAAPALHRRDAPARRQDHRLISCFIWSTEAVR